MRLPMSDSFCCDLDCFLSELKDQSLKKEMTKEAARGSSSST